MATLPARSNAEAHLYMELHPCERCHTIDFAPGSAIVLIDEQPATRFAGACPGCGAPREFVFRLPEQEPFPDEDEPAFGAAEPSQLIDPGQWLWLADLIARSSPAATDELTGDERRQVRFDLRTAAAAVGEAIKFVPADADRVPPESLWSELGRGLYRDEPARFRLRRLHAAQRALRDLADAIAT